MSASTNIYDLLIEDLQFRKSRGQKTLELSKESQQILRSLNEVIAEITILPEVKPATPLAEAPQTTKSVNETPIQNKPVNDLVLEKSLLERGRSSTQMINTAKPTLDQQKPAIVAKPTIVNFTEIEKPKKENKPALTNPFDFMTSIHKNKLAEVDPSLFPQQEASQLIEILLGEKPQYSGGQNLQAPVIFITEYNPVDTDQFANDEGTMLKKMIEGVLKISSEDIFLIPLPSNSNGHPDTSRALVKALIQKIKPKAIMMMGVTPLKLLYGETQIHQHRGQKKELFSYPLIPTYSTKYLLRHTEDKKKTWQDLLQLLAIIQ